MRKDIFVYLSGPITAKQDYSVEENVASALRIYLECIRRGIPAFCPQIGGAFPSAWADVPYETWLAYDFAVIDRCTHLLMLPRWETSAGALREIDHARLRGIPVVLAIDELPLFASEVPA
jgi:hypothetical protein